MGFCEERIIESEGIVWIVWTSILLKGAEGVSVESEGIVWIVWTSILLKGAEGVSVEGLGFSCLALTRSEEREWWNIVPHCSIQFTSSSVTLTRSTRTETDGK